MIKSWADFFFLIYFPNAIYSLNICCKIIYFL